MQFLAISPDAGLSGIVQRVAAEGHKAKLYTTLPKVVDAAVEPHWKPAVKASDLVLMDGTDHLAISTVRGLARFVVGGYVPGTYGYPSPGLPYMALWNGRGWMRPWFHVAALHRMLSGDLGANLPCTALALRPIPAAPVATPTLEHMEPLLRDAEYRGPVLFGRKGEAAVCSEPALWAALAELLREPLGEFLYSVAVGSQQAVRLWRETSLALQLSVPPYPFAEITQTKRPTVQIAPGAAKHFWAADMSVEFGQIGWTGLLGYAAARGRGGTLREAGRRLWRVLSGINGPNLALQYRVDAIDALEREMARGFE